MQPKLIADLKGSQLHNWRGEYNIPAVVSVKGITELEDDTPIAANDYSGEVSVIQTPKD